MRIQLDINSHKGNDSGITGWPAVADHDKFGLASLVDSLRKPHLAKGRYKLKIFARHLHPTLSWPAIAGHPGGLPRWIEDTLFISWPVGETAHFYVGMTNNLIKRVHEHREGLIPGFTKRYGVKMLVHYEVFEIVWDAIHREKRLKKWKREWKINLIQQTNLEWDDLYQSVAEEW